MNVERHFYRTFTMNFARAESISVFTCATILPAVAPQRDSGTYRLLSDAQSIDNRPIARIADVAKIIQQTATTPDERE